jgi:hypothetical protein
MLLRIPPQFLRMKMTLSDTLQGYPPACRCRGLSVLVQCRAHNQVTATAVPSSLRGRESIGTIGSMGTIGGVGAPPVRPMLPMPNAAITCGPGST